MYIAIVDPVLSSEYLPAPVAVRIINFSRPRVRNILLQSSAVENGQRAMLCDFSFTIIL